MRKQANLDSLQRLSARLSTFIGVDDGIVTDDCHFMYLEPMAKLLSRVIARTIAIAALAHCPCNCH